MADILTDADKEAIRTDLLDDDQGRILIELEDFARRIYEGQRTEHDRWFGSILQALSEDHFSPFNRTGTTTRADIVEAFNAAVTEAQDEDIAWFDDDPVSFRDCHRDRDPRKDHLWGNDIVARCRLFIDTATPYRVWRFYQGIQQAALESLKDNLLTMAFLGEGEGYVGDRVQRATEEAIKALSDDLDRRVALESAKVG